MSTFSRNARVRWIGGGAVLLTAFVLWLVLRADPDEYRLSGKPLRYWLEALESESPDRRRAAVSVFRNSGSNAIPHLLISMEREATGTERFVRSALGWVGIRAEFQTSIDRRRAEAAFRALGDSGTNAVPILREIFKDERRDGLARGLFVAIGDPVLPDLIELADHADVDVRRNAIRALGEFGPRASNAVPVLVKYADDADEGVRFWAYVALGIMDGPPEELIPVFVRGLSHPKPGIYEASAKALGRYGHLAAGALPALTNAAAQSNADLQLEARSAIKQIHDSRARVSSATAP